jgi:helicase required for RNAi-mediated heterochromatin assembly 1
MASDLNSSDQILCNHILKPWKQIEYPEAWRNLPEVPTKSEICPDADPLAAKLAVQEAWNDYQNEPGYEIPLPKNIIDGPWNSKEDYIGAHYQILREDVVGPLRRAVSEFRQHPDMLEDNGVGIYTHVSLPVGSSPRLFCSTKLLTWKNQVTFRGIQLSPIGAAFRVEFSNERAGKLIRWDQSKRLVQGSMVAITTQRDNFQSICKVAVIAARPLEGLEQNPPQIDIFWGDDKHTVFDPSEGNEIKVR